MQTSPSTAAAPAASPAPASSAAPEGAADGRATSFQAVTGGETKSGEVLLVEAYAVLWVILFGWLFLMWKKQVKLSNRIDELDRALDRAAAAKGTSK